MRRVFFVCLLGALFAAAYGFWPLMTAWSIKEAVKSGDSGYLARHVDWAPVKVTLKESMSEMVLGRVDASAAGNPGKRSLWQRFKNYYGKSVVENLVERYANAKDLPKLFSYGRSVRRNVLLRTDPDDGLPFHERIAAAWGRVDRAAFITPTRFEIDMRDKFEPSRVYAGVLEFQDWRWIVTELRVHQRQTPPSIAIPLSSARI